MFWEQFCLNGYSKIKMNEPLSIHNINFGYEEKVSIFSNFSYGIKAGEIVSIIGNSGCGKTTLLNLIAGLLTPDNGIISTTNNSYLTQKVSLFSYRTAFENALFACELRNDLTFSKIKEAAKLFQQFNLSDSSKTKFPQELSGGMQQRVALIQALLVDAELYLLDEPFNAIDRTTSLSIQDFVWDRFKQKRLSLIIVTHDIEDAILLGNRVLILSAVKENQEILFDIQFSKLKPQERLTSKYYKRYMLEIIEKQKIS